MDVTCTSHERSCDGPLAGQNEIQLQAWAPTHASAAGACMDGSQTPGTVKTTCSSATDFTVPAATYSPAVDSTVPGTWLPSMQAVIRLKVQLQSLPIVLNTEVQASSKEQPVQGRSAFAYIRNVPSSISY
eukprot:359447-Chlamydomonas_euryale.AAC.3